MKHQWLQSSVPAGNTVQVVNDSIHVMCTLPSGKLKGHYRCIRFTSCIHLMGLHRWWQWNWPKTGATLDYPGGAGGLGSAPKAGHVQHRRSPGTSHDDVLCMAFNTCQHARDRHLLHRQGMSAQVRHCTCQHACCVICATALQYLVHPAVADC